MDKELLAALNNVSSALEQLSKMLAKKGDSKEKKSDTTKALQGGNLKEHLVQIDKTLKDLKKDNKEIIKKQDTIIQLSKQKQTEKDPLAKATDPKQKSKLKDGLASIMMIAVGVLAIGAAFKLIGNVNFLSVISLAIALPLVAIAFEKIAKMTELKGANIGKLLLVTVTIATAIALSSRILKFVQPVGIFQLITSIFIAGMFAVVSYSIGKLFKNIKDLDPKSAWKLPIIMVAVAAAIVGSSYLLGAVKPVGLFQLITSVFIAAMFAAVSFGLGKLLSSFKDINPTQALKIGLVLPVVMLAVAYAIQLSSEPLSKVQPIGLYQFFTAVMIAIVFIPISFALKYVGEAVKDIDYGKIAILPLILVAMAAAIWLTSKILVNVTTIPFGTLVNIVLQAAALAAIGVVLSFAFKFIAKTDIEEYIKGGLAIVIIAATIAIASQLISMGDYKNTPSIEWAIAVGLSLGFFGLGAVLLGTQVLNPFFYAGLGAILVVAGTIVLTSIILNAGNFKNYPSINWVIPTIMVLGAWGVISVALGIISPLIALGSIAILMISGTIWLVDKIFTNGEFKKFPNDKWVLSSTKVINKFAIMATRYALISPLIILGAISLALVAGTIWLVDKIFNKGQFKNYPSKVWVDGTSNAISGFVSLMSNTSFTSVLGGKLKSLFGGGIDDVANKIVQLDNIFNKGQFKNYPSKDWLDGTSNAISGFLSLMSNTSFTSVLGGKLKSLFGGGIDDVANKIVQLDNIFSKGNFKIYPPMNWMQSLATNIKMFMGISDSLTKDFSTTGIIKSFSGMNMIAKSFDLLAKGLSKINLELEKIDADKLNALKNLTGSVVLMSLMDADQFNKMMDAFESKAKIFVDVINDLDSKTEVGKGTKAATTSYVKTTKGPAGPPPKNINDLYNIMSIAVQQLGAIAKSNDNLSKYVDEVRTGDNTLKKNKIH